MEHVDEFPEEVPEADPLDTLGLSELTEEYFRDELKRRKRSNNQGLSGIAISPYPFPIAREYRVIIRPLSDMVERDIAQALAEGFLPVPMLNSLQIMDGWLVFIGSKEKEADAENSNP